MSTPPNSSKPTRARTSLLRSVGIGLGAIVLTVLLIDFAVFRELESLVLAMSVALFMSHAIVNDVLPKVRSYLFWAWIFWAVGVVLIFGRIV